MCSTQKEAYTDRQRREDLSLHELSPFADVSACERVRPPEPGAAEGQVPRRDSLPREHQGEGSSLFMKRIQVRILVYKLQKNIRDSIFKLF